MHLEIDAHDDEVESLLQCLLLPCQLLCKPWCRVAEIDEAQTLFGLSSLPSQDIPRCEIIMKDAAGVYSLHRSAQIISGPVSG